MSDQNQDTAALHEDRRNFDQGRLFLLILFIIALGIAGVWGIVLPSWRPNADMERQPYYRPYEPTSVFTDSMSERPLASGVVPRPSASSPGIPYVAVRTPGPANYPANAPSGKIPFPITRQILEEGQEQYTIYCSVCHGATGDGRGMIVQRGFYPPPSYHIQRLRESPDSHFYDVITNGYGAMFSYSDRVTPDNRWKVVAYIRALQLAVERAGALDRDMQKPAGVQP